jgi:hypothetical protein
MPKKRTKAQQLLPDLADWSVQELRELQDMIQGLVEAKEAEAEEEALTRPDGSPIGKHGGQGHIELKRIPNRANGKLYGPYRYLRYHSTGPDGKTVLKSVYLGKAQGGKAGQS